MRILDDAVAGLSGKTIPGEVVFRLYDTYGFPIDLTADVARERGLEVDQGGFDSLMQGQREQARAASRFSEGATSKVRGRREIPSSSATSISTASRW